MQIEITQQYLVSQGLSKTFQSRFWKKVNPNGPVPIHFQELGPCWTWTASTTKWGYGHLAAGFRGATPIAAHRASWIITVGPIPDGMWVLHKCDNKLCVRTAHLFLGTRQDNVDDCVKKGRNRFPTGHGEKSCNHKLTNSIAEEIRSLYPQMTQRALAQKFGVCQGTINRVVNRLRWNH